jgi:predicted ATP-dependent endonuclease of OLD family
MELNRISICNFRSIPEDFKLIIKPKCRVLIGINESGKTNILKALSLLSSDAKPSKKDIREPLAEEGPIKNASVIFHYVLSSDELKKVYTNIKKNILCPDINKPILIQKNKKLSLYEFMNDVNEIIYEVDLKNETKQANYWELSKKYIIIDKWKKPSKDAPATYKLRTGNEIELNKKLLIDIGTDAYKDIDEKYLTDIKPEDVNDLIGKELVSFFE